MGKSAEEIARKYGGVAVDEPAAPNADEIAKKYGGIVESTPAPTTAPAAPSFLQRVKGEEYGLPASILARGTESFVEGAKGLATSAYHAYTDAPKPEEVATLAGSGRVGLAGKRLLFDPQREEYLKSKEANTSSEAFGHAVAAGTPFAGPITAQLVDQALNQGIPEALGSLALIILTGKATKAFTEFEPPKSKSSPLTAPPTERQISSIATMAQPGVSGVKPLESLPTGAIKELRDAGIDTATVNDYAKVAIPYLQQGMAEAGKTAEMLPTRGATNAGKEAVRQGGQHVMAGVNQAVRIANRPFEDVLRQHGDLPLESPYATFRNAPGHLTVKGRLLSDLRAAAANYADQPATMREFDKIIKRVEAAKTYNDLQTIKAEANNQTAKFYEQSLGEQLSGTANAATAWRAAGDAVRANMYPELSRISGVDLTNAGRTEAIIMDVRDGIRQHYANEVLDPHNRLGQQQYTENLARGSLARRSLMKRALMLEPTPAGQFNKLFMRGVGEIPQMPGVVPFNPRGNFNFAPSEMGGTQLDLIPHEATPVRTGPGSDFPMVTDQEALLAPPPGVSRAMAEEIFKVQQRANREARSAPPPTIGPGKQVTFGEKSSSTHTGKPGPAGEFFPGKKGTVVDTNPGGRQMFTTRGEPLLNKEGKQLYEHDYRGQEHLFSIKQTPIRFNPMQRATYTMQDLTSMLHEIQDFVKNNPNHPQVSELMRDVESVRNELHRRQEAHKVPKKEQ